MPDPSIRATTKAANVERFMKTPAEAIEEYRPDCAQTVETGRRTVNVLPLWRVRHAVDRLGLSVLGLRSKRK